MDENKDSANMTLQEFLETILPLMMTHTVDRIDKDIEYVGKVSAYWVVNILRIDIKPYDPVIENN